MLKCILPQMWNAVADPVLIMNVTHNVFSLSVNGAIISKVDQRVDHLQNWNWSSPFHLTGCQVLVNYDLE